MRRARRRTEIIAREGKVVLEVRHARGGIATVPRRTILWNDRRAGPCATAAVAPMPGAGRRSRWRATVNSLRLLRKSEAPASPHARKRRINAGVLLVLAGSHSGIVGRRPPPARPPFQPGGLGHCDTTGPLQHSGPTSFHGHNGAPPANARRSQTSSANFLVGRPLRPSPPRAAEALQDFCRGVPDNRCQAAPRSRRRPWQPPRHRSAVTTRSVAGKQNQAEGPACKLEC